MTRAAWRTLALAVTAWLTLTPLVSAQDRPLSLDLPPEGSFRSHQLANGVTDHWHLGAAAGQLVDVAIEPIGITLNDTLAWPRVTVFGPGGTPVDDATAPAFTLSIDTGLQFIVSFVAASGGDYEIRVAAEHQAAPQLPYRLTTRRHVATSDTDQVHVTAIRLAREALQTNAANTPEAHQTGLRKLESARALLQDRTPEDEDIAALLNTMAAVHYQMSEGAAGQALDLRALERWRAADPMHAHAYDEAERLWIGLGAIEQAAPDRIVAARASAWRA